MPYSARSSSGQQSGTKSTVSLGTPLSRMTPQGELIDRLIKSLKSNSNPQTQYWAVCCLWQLSFETIAAKGLDK
ncbi:MAG: hypothetical protein EOO85_10275 [Pedobacter sp.]|nr:MAG: hypothetical protein EOO85_10275 [Pedobacter sp.]